MLKLQSDASQMTFYLWIISGIASLGGFLFGFDSSIIADTKDQIVNQFSLTDFQWSIVVSMSLIGSAIGIPLSGCCADYLSRKTLLIFVACGFILGTICCMRATQLNPLLVGRFLIGICIGIASYISPLFIAEMSPAKSRGQLILINGVSITFGQAFAFLIGFFLYDVSQASWRIMFAMGLFPALCLLLGMLIIPHSPRWLLLKKGVHKTQQVLRKIRSTDTEVQLELAEINASLHIKTESNNAFLRLFKPPLLYVLLFGICLGIFQQFSGINAFMYYGPVIFKAAGFSTTKIDILATFWIGLLNFIFTIVTLLLVDYIGRRALLIFGTLLASISLICIGFYFQLKFQSLNWLMLALMSTYVIGYCINIVTF